MTPTASPVACRLDRISTHLSILRDTDQFVFRYGPAIRAYLHAILRDPDAADEVSQDVVAKLLTAGGPERWPRRGRYRFYLKVTVRNAAISHLRRKCTRQMPDEWFDGRAASGNADAEWVSKWQKCLLERAWRELERGERTSPGMGCATVLRLAIDHPDADSTTLASLLAAKLGRPVTPEAFRQQLCRARRQMALALIAEVRATIASPTPEAMREELMELNLWPMVRKYIAEPEVSSRPAA